MTTDDKSEAGGPRGGDAATGKEQRSRRRHQDLTGQPRRGHPWWVTALILAAVFIVGLAVWFAPTFATSSTSYCSSCKVMKPAYDTWARSVHKKDTGCLSCHVEPGVLNKLRWRQSEAVNIWSSYLGADKEMLRCANCTPSNDACRSCHDDIDDLPTAAGGVKMPHEEHTTARNLDCVDCHSQVAHAPKGGTPTVSMATCSMCHNGAAAPDECALCHAEQPVAEAHPPAFVETHGAQAAGRIDDCLRCHHDKAAFCDDCHARPPVSHFAGDWRYGHAAAAATNAACVGCHDTDTFCEQCHKVTHPSGWAEGHADVAVRGDDSCLVCHPRSMCDECHRKRGVAP